MGEKIRADIILRQLEKRHTCRRNQEEVFFTQVKNGSSWFTDNLLIMDAVAFKKSWKNPCITGYEVKVDRQDFLRDDKWPGYLKYCHRFSFACPAGLIAPEELPDEVGLIYYNPQKDCISTKRKAPFRVIEIPWEMLYYLVISRLDSHKHPFFSSTRDFLMAWVQDKTERQELARKVGSKMVKRIMELEEQVIYLKRDLYSYENELKKFQRVKEIMKKHGISIWHMEEDLEKSLSRGMPPRLVDNLKRISREVNDLVSIVQAEVPYE